MSKPLTRIGWREHVSLPDLGLEAIAAKIDTGAQTSALHVTGIKHLAGPGEGSVRFVVRLGGGDRQVHELPVVATRRIKSSNGVSEARIVVRTRLVLGPVSRKVEFTLTNRRSMTYPILIGRSAMRRFEIEPTKSFLQDLPKGGDAR